LIAVVVVLVAQIKLKQIFQSSTAYQIVYERLLERNPDDIKISECAETFLTLLHAMEGQDMTCSVHMFYNVWLCFVVVIDRYRLVPYPSCSLRLFSLQIDLLHSFLDDLKFSSVHEQNDFDPLSKRSCSILNSIVYIADVIQQWKNRSVSSTYRLYSRLSTKINYDCYFKYYKQLQNIYDEYTSFARKHANSPTMNMLSTDRIEIDSTLAQQFDLIQLNKECRLVTATIFDNLLEQYRDEEEKHCNSIVNYIMKLLKTRSRRYIREK
jgi:hypothetical protein